jgi:hypothetical protein
MMIAKSLFSFITLTALVVTFVVITAPGTSFATTFCGGDNGKYVNGVSTNTSIDIGCVGKGNGIADMLFAFIRFLSDGVGLVVIGSIILGGIQFTSSQGNPQDTAKAIARIRSSLFAFLLYIFGYAILNYLIPAGFLH